VMRPASSGSRNVSSTWRSNSGISLYGMKSLRKLLKFCS
jgi:hypothetical protein